MSESALRGPDRSWPLNQHPLSYSGGTARRGPGPRVPQSARHRAASTTAVSSAPGRWCAAVFPEQGTGAQTGLTLGHTARKWQGPSNGSEPLQHPSFALTLPEPPPPELQSDPLGCKPRPRSRPAGPPCPRPQTSVSIRTMKPLRLLQGQVVVRVKEEIRVRVPTTRCIVCGAFFSLFFGYIY